MPPVGPHLGSLRLRNKQRQLAKIPVFFQVSACSVLSCARVCSLALSRCVSERDCTHGHYTIAPLFPSLCKPQRPPPPLQVYSVGGPRDLEDNQSAIAHAFRHHTASATSRPSTSSSNLSLALSGFQDEERVEIAPPAASAAGNTTYESNKTLDTTGTAQRHSQYDHAALAKRYPATVIVPGMLGAIVSSNRSSSSRSMLSMSRSATASRSLLAVRSNADHVNLIEELVPAVERSTVTLRK